MGWPEGVAGQTSFAYAYPRQHNQSGSARAFTEWTDAVQVDLKGWMDPAVFAGGAIM